MNQMSFDVPYTPTSLSAVQQAINAAPESVLLTDVSGVIEVANVSALALLDLGDGDIRGRNLAVWLDDTGAAGFKQALVRVGIGEPGIKLEELVATLQCPAPKRMKLSIAQMRHRRGLCIVMNELHGPATVDAPEQGVLQKQVVKPSHDAEPGFGAGAPSFAPARRDDAPVAEKQPARDEATNRLFPDMAPEERFSEPPAIKPRPTMPRVHDEMDCFTPSGLHKASSEPEEAERGGLHARQLSSAKTSASAAGEEPGSPERRPPAEAPVKAQAGRAVGSDLYAMLETERERRQRIQQEVIVLPAECLERAVKKHMPEAVSGAVKLNVNSFDAGRDVSLDEDDLVRLFDILVSRLVAVSPPYCDAEIVLEPLEPKGFRATFVDIGRGLTEKELNLLVAQPELVLSVSHTRLHDAQQVANSLGVGLSIRSAVDTGTSVEVIWHE